MRNPSDDPDKLLGIALATYADPEKSVDPALLAARVISIARAQEQHRSWGWAWAASAVLAGLLILVVTPKRPHMVSKTHLHSELPQISRVVPLESPSVRRVTRKWLPSSRTNASRHRPPKLGRFPTPEPPSSQEKLLVVFVSRTSLATQLAVTQAEGPPQPLKVAALTVPPIDQSKKEIQNPGEQDEENR